MRRSAVGGVVRRWLDVRRLAVAPLGVAWLAATSLAAAPRPALSQVLRLPARPADAPGASAIVPELRSLDREAREERIYDEVASGNVPSWLRSLRGVEMIGEVDGRAYAVTFFVTPDVLAIGSDTDYFRVPLTPQTAQRIADLTGTSLLTPPMSDAVWRAAAVKLGPDSIAPSPAMTTVPVFERHNAMVAARRAVHSEPPGALVAGHQKDVVLTARLDTLPDRVAIYGWHKPDGRPIQPLYSGHTNDWVDYSHGIRLVAREILIDGEPRDIVDVLRDPGLAWLISDEGAMRAARYPTRDLPREPAPT